MKNYQHLIGLFFIAVAIIAAGIIISNTLEAGFSNNFSALDRLGNSIRDGLLQIGQ